jgi:hypothetical protein
MSDWLRPISRLMDWFLAHRVLVCLLALTGAKSIYGNFLQPIIFTERGLLARFIDGVGDGAFWCATAGLLLYAAAYLVRSFWEVGRAVFLGTEVKREMVVLKQAIAVCFIVWLVWGVVVWFRPLEQYYDVTLRVIFRSILELAGVAVVLALLARTVDVLLGKISIEIRWRSEDPETKPENSSGGAVG